MTDLVADFESGTVGATVTATNSGFGAIINTTPDPWVITSDTTHGTKGSTLTPSANGHSIYGQWTGQNDSALAMQGTFRFNDSPGSGVDQFLLRGLSSGSTAVIAVKRISTNQFRLVQGSTTYATSNVGTVPTDGSPVTVDFFIDITNGKARLAWRSANASSYTYDSGMLTGQSLGSTNVASALGGAIGAISTAAMSVDNVIYRPAALDIVGIPSPPPVAAFTATASALVASFDGTTSTVTSPATISSYNWSFGDGNTGTGSTISHTYSATGQYTVTLTVTDSTGTTGSISYAVQVASAATSGGVDPLTLVTGETLVGATTLQLALNDSSDASYAQSPANPSSYVRNYPLMSVAYIAGQPLKVTVREAMVGNTGTITVALYEGTTIRSAGQFTNLTTSFADYVITFPATDCANVTNWDNAVVRKTVTVS